MIIKPPPRSTNKSKYKKRKDHLVYEDFVKWLKQKLPHFTELRQENQLMLAYYIFWCPKWPYKHKIYTDQASFHYHQLAVDFGRGEFVKINDLLQVFDVSDYDKIGETSRGYELKPAVAAIRTEYLEVVGGPLTEQIRISGTYQRTIPKSLASKDSSGNTRKAFRGAQPRGLIPIDRSGVVYFRDLLIMRPQPKYLKYESKYLIEECSLLLKESNTKLAGFGNIMIRYFEIGSGRLYAVGGSLQTSPRVVRFAALAGKYDYDFENCHFTIFDQMAAHNGYVCENIRYYLAHKAMIRQELAEYLGATIPEVKACLLALMYGASINPYPAAAIPEILGNPKGNKPVPTGDKKADMKALTAWNPVGKEKAKRLYSHKYFSSLTKDVNQAGPIIIESHPLSRASYKNALGKFISEDTARRKILAHLIQGVEALALQVCLGLYDEEILLLLHDGFVSDKQLDPQLMEAAILEETGYILEMSEEVLEAPGILAANL